MRELTNALGELLVAKKLKIAAAESCTGGLVAAALVDYPGISACLDEAHVTYANEAKVRYCKVKQETLDAHGAVSEETAREMAEGLREKACADIALATTGIAGPGGGTKEKPVGLVYVACASAHGTKIQRLQLCGDRRQVREQAVLRVLQLALDAAAQYE
ncbi:MAG: CinA family protein [Clostridia bacterium]|nr:CinA family protein [Clostridia bacterium]